MYLNTFSTNLGPLDLTRTDEFQNLLASARDLGIEVDPTVRYVSGNRVVNGLRIHFLEWGDPGLPPLVLVHGGGQSAHSWDLVSIVLAKHFHIVALDMRGHGDSEWPRDGDMATPKIGEDVAALTADFGFDRPAMMGHSLGGLSVMYALIANPALASRAVFVDVAPHIEGAISRGTGFAPEEFEFDSVEAFVAEVVRRETGRSAEHLMRTARYNLMQRSDGKFVPKRYRNQIRGNPMRPTLEATVAAVRCPALLLHGEQSTSLSADTATKFASALSAGQLVHVPNCGHNIHSQNTPGFLAAVIPFVTSK